jgi:hypothetical protein
MHETCSRQEELNEKFNLKKIRIVGYHYITERNIISHGHFLPWQFHFVTHGCCPILRYIVTFTAYKKSSNYPDGRTFPKQSTQTGFSRGNLRLKPSLDKVCSPGIGGHVPLFSAQVASAVRYSWLRLCPTSCPCPCNNPGAVPHTLCTHVIICS